MAEVEQVRERAPRIKDQAEGAPARDPESHTHWARDDDARVRQLTNQGYRLAKESDIDSSKIEERKGYKQGDGVRNGDLVLMVAPRAAMEKRELDRIAQNVHTDSVVSKIQDKEGDFTSDSARNYQVTGGKKSVNIPWEAPKK